MTTHILRPHAIMSRDATRAHIDVPAVLTAAALVLLLPMAGVVLAFLR